ncbi:MAG: EFR1 family ferrodoxin [bacterium]
MKTILYYFTGTGNSLKIARDLAEVLNHTDLCPMAGLIAEEHISVSSDRVGIICPVYMWGLPLIVQDFIEKLNLNKSQYVFAVLTYGGFPAGTLKQIDKLLHSKGLKLSAGFGVRMPGNYIPMYGAFSEKKQAELFSKEKEKIEQIAEMIEENKSVNIKGCFFPADWIFSGLIHKLGSQKMLGLDKDFWVNEKCNGCGICAKVCPVNNIKMNEEKPIWQHHCQQCLACLHWCPQEAIEFGKHTPGRKRYRHPEVYMEDMIMQGHSEPIKS